MDTPFMKMKSKQNFIAALSLALGLTSALPLSAQTNHWTIDVSLYGVAAGMSGNVAVKGIPADVDVGFDKIWDNLEWRLDSA